MKLDVYQCTLCYHTEAEPAGQVRIFIGTCPRCGAAMEKTETAVSGPEYDAKTKDKMKKLKKNAWRFV